MSSLKLHSYDFQIYCSWASDRLFVHLSHDFSFRDYYSMVLIWCIDNNSVKCLILPKSRVNGKLPLNPTFWKYSSISSGKGGGWRMISTTRFISLPTTKVLHKVINNLKMLKILILDYQLSSTLWIFNVWFFLFKNNIVIASK